MKLIYLLVVLTFLIFLHPTNPSSTSFTKEDLNLTDTRILVAKVERLENLLEFAMPGYTPDDPVFSTTVTATSYTPLKAQWDSTPLSDSPTKLVKPGTVAVPQAYRQRIGMKLGQRVLLEGYGMFTVTGHMNDRFEEQAKVDVISFIPKWSKKFGIQENVKMIWWRHK
jgi:hypothetical protein